MEKEKPRHAPVRHDIFTHPRTAWMSPDHLAVYLLACSASILGVSTYSLSKIARLIGADHGRVATACSDLDEHGNCKWWPDDEILWAVERADESKVSGRAWWSAQREMASYPRHVREAIVDRYPILGGPLRDREPGYLSAGGKGHKRGPYTSPIDRGDDHPPGTGYGLQSTVSGLQSTVTVSSRSPTSTTDEPPTAESKARAAYISTETIRDRLQCVKPSGLLPLLIRHDKIKELLEAGATVDEIVATVERLRDAVEAGSVSRDKWTATYVFSGWYDRLRNDVGREDEEPL